MTIKVRSGKGCAMTRAAREPGFVFEEIPDHPLKPQHCWCAFWHPAGICATVTYIDRDHSAPWEVCVTVHPRVKGRGPAVIHDQFYGVYITALEALQEQLAKLRLSDVSSSRSLPN